MILIKILRFLFLLSIVLKDFSYILEEVLIKGHNISYNLYIKRARGGLSDNKRRIFLRGVVLVEDGSKR